MSLPRYPNYKDSGVEWLGEVPGHWDVVPIKQVIKLIESGVSVNSTDTPATAEESGVLKTSCVYRGEFDPAENKAVVPEEYDRLACPVTAGTLIVSRMNTPDLVGAAGVVRESRTDLFLPDRLWQIHFRGVDAAYVHYWSNTPSYRAQVEMACAGTSSSMQNLSQENFRCFAISTPPLPEQTQIAAFLDRETAKIDELVAEQQRLMALLKEKRQAVISHAVTRGLNPHAPLKPSGIEWLGDVPEHWEVGPLKRYWSVTDCKHVTAEFVEDGIPLASIREVQSRWVALDSAKCTTEYFYELLIEGNRCPSPGDLIFSRNATVGEVAQVNENHPRFAMGQDVVLLRKLSENYSSDYLQHVIRSPIIILQLANMMIGSTFKRINVEEIRSFVMPSPPVAEQTEIANFLEQKLDGFDTLTTEAQRAIALLQERRTALISAAVTGQIDVRGAVVV